ncbi:MATE efflux family protein 5 [Artemisia annua]|uniref:Protein DETOXIFICATION n=1 Tax=Artemisia annua TaxID=35608 RepID=A0A2U1LW60_ARTAN|nr:MATE efflux family protein 5 [Artemisia annua]
MDQPQGNHVVALKVLFKSQLKIVSVGAPGWLFTLYMKELFTSLGIYNIIDSIGSLTDSVAHTSYLNHASNIVSEWTLYLRYSRVFLSVGCGKSFTSTFVLGRIGELETAGGSLSNAITNITGFSVIYGLSMGMDGITPQAYGASNFTFMAQTLHRTMLILLTTTIPITILWLNAKPVLIFAGQDVKVSEIAATYMYFTIPSLFLQCFIQPIKIYLKAKEVTRPIIIGSVLALLTHVAINGLVLWFEFGIKGAALAVVVTDIVYLLTLLVYMHTTCDISIRTFDFVECFAELTPILSLAIPSCWSACLEWWFYDLMIFLSGLLPKDTKANISAMNFLLQATSLIYIFPLALSSAVSARVGRELGSNLPKKAKKVSFIAVSCAFIIGFIAVAFTTMTRKSWGSIFTKDKTIILLITTVMPVLGVCEIANCPQTTISGMLSGCARPNLGAWIYFGAFYVIGLPMAGFMGFAKGMGLLGLWYGLLVAQWACFILMLISLLKTDWEKEADRAQELVN